MTKTKPTLNAADIQLLKSIFATKDDLKSFATKNDLDKKLDALEKRLKIHTAEEIAKESSLLMNYFESMNLESHEGRIENLEQEIGITSIVV